MIRNMVILAKQICREEYQAKKILITDTIIIYYLVPLKEREKLPGIF